MNTFITSSPSANALEMDLAFTYKSQYADNEDSIDRAKKHVIRQGAVAFAGTANLLFALLQIR